MKKVISLGIVVYVLLNVGCSQTKDVGTDDIVKKSGDMLIIGPLESRINEKDPDLEQGLEDKENSLLDKVFGSDIESHINTKEPKFSNDEVDLKEAPSIKKIEEPRYSNDEVELENSNESEKRTVN